MGMFDDLLNRRKKEQEMKETKRLPPGQSLTEKFPVLTYGPNPRFDVNTWDLRLFGDVQAVEGQTFTGEIGIFSAEAIQVYNDLFWERDVEAVLAKASPEFREYLSDISKQDSFDDIKQARAAVIQVYQNQPQTVQVTNDNLLHWSFEQFLALPTVDVTTDIHCVTRWSKFDTTWRGVSFNYLMSLVNVSDKAQFVIAHCDYGYTTNVPMEAMTEDDVLLTYEYEGAPLEPDHGAPVRTFVPKRYFWKSAKFVRALEFSQSDKPGFWEKAGYHNDGDPWKEERYGRRGFF